MSHVNVEEVRYCFGVQHVARVITSLSRTYDELQQVQNQVSTQAFWFLTPSSHCGNTDRTACNIRNIVVHRNRKGDLSGSHSSAIRPSYHSSNVQYSTTPYPMSSSKKVQPGFPRRARELREGMPGPCGKAVQGRLSILSPSRCPVRVSSCYSSAENETKRGSLQWQGGFSFERLTSSKIRGDQACCGITCTLRLCRPILIMGTGMGER